MLRKYLLNGAHGVQLHSAAESPTPQTGWSRPEQTS